MQLNSLVFPAPKPSYDDKEPGLIMVPHKNACRSKLEHEQSFSKGVKVKAVATNSLEPVQINQQDIPCLLLGEKYIQNGLILYFHANAEDIAMSKDLGKALVQQMEFAFLTVEYPGYGIYKSKSGSDQMIQDAFSVMHYVSQITYIERVIILARSIGCGVAIEVAQKYPRLRCLTLLSPFTSLQDIIKEFAGKFLSQLVKERFRNLEKIQNVRCPILFIHGSNDTVVPPSHSQLLFGAAKAVSKLEIIPEMDHNLLIFKTHVSEPLKRFLSDIEN